MQFINASTFLFYVAHLEVGARFRTEQEQNITAFTLELQQDVNAILFIFYCY